jgi:hypothetical protein
MEQSEQLDPLRQNPVLQVNVQESLKVKTALPKVEFLGPSVQFKQIASELEPATQFERYLPAGHDFVEQSVHIFSSLKYPALQLHEHVDWKDKLPELV